LLIPENKNNFIFNFIKKFTPKVLKDEEKGRKHSLWAKIQIFIVNLLIEPNMCKNKKCYIFAKPS